MEVHEIESAIRQLSDEELAKLTEWFKNYVADVEEEVDRKLEDAIDRGFFDEMARQAEAERQAGCCAPL